MSDKNFGRPSDYKPEYCEKAKQMLKDGMSKVEVAYHLDVNIVTMDRWIADNEDFRKVITEDASFSEGWWTDKGRTNLENTKFNNKLYELNMMNRHKWNRRTEENVKHTIKSHEDILKELK